MSSDPHNPTSDAPASSKPSTSTAPAHPSPQARHAQVEDAAALAQFVDRFTAKRVVRPNPSIQPTVQATAARLLKAPSPDRYAGIAASIHAEERNRRREAVERCRKNSAVPVKYQFASFENMDLPRRQLSPQQFDQYRNAADELKSCLLRPRTLIVLGDAGPGKTHLACALVNAFCSAGRSGRYATASRFFLELKSTFGAEGRTQVDLVDKWSRFALLVIDEVDVRSESKWENWTLRDLLTARDANELSTVMISNKTLYEIANSFSAPVLDRIREGVIECHWPSLRGHSNPTGDHHV